MPLFSGTLDATPLAQVLQMLINSKQSGHLKIEEGDQEGYIAVENGQIVDAKTGPYLGLHALFEFVGWHHARFNFEEGTIPGDSTRDLQVYDPPVLIAGVAAKGEEFQALQQAIPSLDSVVLYTGAQKIESVGATPADLGLLVLANGHRSVREIAERAKMSPLEVSRSLARFRLAGVLKLVTPKSRALAA